MNELIESIVNKQYTKADELIHEALKNIVDRKLHEVKKMCAAKMSVEQLNVDAQGKFREATGNEKLVSIEKAERGLAEGDVVSLGDKFETDSYHVHVGSKEDSPVIITNKRTGNVRKVSGGRARVGIYRNAEKGLKDEHVDDILYGSAPDAKKPETMKEEAKKAAKELSARALRFRAALSGEKPPEPTLVKSKKND